MPVTGHMRSSRQWLLMVAAGIGLGFFAAIWGATTIDAAPGHEIRVNVPSQPEILAGSGEATVSVTVSAANLYGYQFVVTFDPAIVEASQAGFDSSFVQPEYSPPAWSASIDNVSGTVRFAVTQFNPTPPVTGTGQVATVTFRALTPASLPAAAEIGLAQVRLATADGELIEPVSVYSGTLIVVPASELVVDVPPPGEVLEANGGITATLVLTGQNVMAYTYTVTFDPALLAAEAAGFDDAFMSPDEVPAGWNADINNTAGTVQFAASQLTPTLPVTGSGPIGWVEFVGQSPVTLPATATVGISGVHLRSPDRLPMTPQVLSGQIRVLPKAVVTGRVELQGRTDWSGAEILASPSGSLGLTGATGWYTLSLPAASYTVTVDMARYLDAEREVVAGRGLTALPALKLLAGDANDDDNVDIVDLGIVGLAYDLVVDPAAERGDINADGVVDIVDIGLVGINYDRTGVSPW
jgi:hypothetical protein